MYLEVRYPLLLVCIMGICLVASLVVHELGHSVTCSYFGYDSPITINLTQSHAECEAAGMERTYVRLMGGGTAAVLFLLVLIPNFVRRNNYLRPALLAGGITNFINAIIETSIPTQYNTLYIIILGISDMLLWPNIILITGLCITIMIEWKLFKQIMKKG